LFFLRSAHISYGIPDPNVQASNPASAAWVWPG